MKRGVILLLFIIILPSVFSTSVDSEIRNVVTYAQDYETGNINFAKLSIYLSASRQRLGENFALAENQGILKQDQLREILGEPTDQREWVWIEDGGYEKRLNEPLPIWEKVIFDGNKIQIRLNSYPSIISKDNEDSIIYRLHFSTDFKKPKEQLNIFENIDKITNLAKLYGSNPTDENAQILARESANQEKTFQSYIRQSGSDCQDTMNGIFGSENKIETQKVLLQQAAIFKGKNFDITARLEMCEDCEWDWIGLYMWVDSRGRGIKDNQEEQNTQQSRESLVNSDDTYFQAQIKSDFDQLIESAQKQDFSSIYRLINHIRILVDAWNEASNQVVKKQIEEIYRTKQSAMAQTQNAEPYWWIRLDAQRRQEEKQIQKQMYQKRKDFLLGLLSSYEKKEFYYSQDIYQKRLVELFGESKREICDNNLDDNNDNNIDCADEQCQGRICGKQIVQNPDGTQEQRELHCISNICQLPQYNVQDQREAICGNHICEQNENITSCAADCIRCNEYPPIECNGNIIFSGRDQNNCPLQPICISSSASCQTDQDCVQPLCGSSSCIENTCRITAIGECRQAQCENGNQRTQRCQSQEEIIVEQCIDNLWRSTGIQCQSGVASEVSQQQAPVVGNQCTLKEDCGNPNDVCSNGRCITIPQNTNVLLQEQQIEQIQEQVNEQIQEPTNNKPQEPLSQQATSEQTAPEPTQRPTAEQAPPPQRDQGPPPSQQDTSSEPTGITGFLIKSINSITGFIVSLTDSEQTTNEVTPTDSQTSTDTQPASTDQQDETPPPQRDQGLPPQQQQNIPQPNQQIYQRTQQDIEAERKLDCENRCKDNCRTSLTFSCTNKCVEESGCKDSSCIEEQIKKCDESCSSTDQNSQECVLDCFDKCMTGSDWQPKQEKHQTTVFQLGGQCRSESQRKEGGIFFDGWGDPFEKIRGIKERYNKDGSHEWCKDELENLIKQRKEFEQSFNQEFATWFFEKYLTNSPEDWSLHFSGIYELYYKDVEISRRLMELMECANANELPQYNLINISYKTDYGELEYWEEIKKVKFEEIDKQREIISPYMRVWIFPPREFIIAEMTRAMQAQQFPGSPEERAQRKNEDGISDEDKIQIKQNKNFMKMLRKLTDKYNGAANIVIDIKDYQTNQTVFNIYAILDQENILQLKPMLPSQVPKQDIKIELDFQKIYDLISSSAKEVEGGRTQHPPWEKQKDSGGVKEIVDGVKMYFKVMGIINSAKIYPESQKKDVEKLIREFFNMAMKEGMSQDKPPQQ